MDYRTESFRKRFQNAGQILGVGLDKIVSLKMRDTVNSNTYCRDLVDTITTETGLICKDINSSLQERAYLLSNSRNKVIIVEHESGLELLYIAGSIASIISLIPLVLQYWGRVRNNINNRHHHFDRQVMELRRIDNKGNLHEEHLHGMDILYETSSLAFPKAELVENEMKMLREEIKILSARIDIMEKRVPNKSRPRKRLRKSK